MRFCNAVKGKGNDYINFKVYMLIYLQIFFLVTVRNSLRVPMRAQSRSNYYTKFLVSL